MSDDEDLLPPAPLPIEVVPKRSLAERRQDSLQEVTDELLQESQSILCDALGFADLDEQHLMEGASPPEAWVEALGEKRAKRRLRVAKMALLPKKEAPAGLEMVRALAVGILSSKAKDKSGTKVLNVAFVNVPAPPQYDVITLETKK